MLKRSKAIVLSLALLAGYSSFAQPKPAAESTKKDDVAHFREYVPEDNSFTLLYPSSWKIVPNQKPPTAVAFADPASVKPGSVTDMITLVIVPNKATFDVLTQEVKKQMAAKEGFTLIDDANFTVGTWKTHRFVFDAKANGLTARAIQFLMVKDQSAYVMTFYMSPEKYTKEAEDRAFQLCGTFKLGGSDQPTTTTPDGPIAFESKEFGFSLSYPPTWNKQALDQKGIALAIARRASAGKVPQILMVMADNLDPDEKVDLKEMEAKLIESTKASLKDGKVIESADSKLGGEPARRVILGGTRVADDHQGRVILTFAIKGRSTFGLMAGGPIEDFDKVKSDVDKIVASFKFAGATEVKPTPSSTQTKPPVATDTKPQAGPTLFDSPALGLKLTYPATWTARKSSDPTIPLMLLSTPTRPGARPNTITLTTEPVTPGTRASLKEQSDGALAGLKASLPDAKVIESADVKVGNEKGRRMVVGGHTAAKIEMRSIFLLFQHGSDALTLSGQAPAEEFAALKEAFDGLASSIELAVPAPKK